MYKTKFYYLLKKATNDEKSLILVIDRIMPLINKYSLKSNKKVIDEDLKSVLIEYCINVIKNEEFADKLAKKNIENFDDEI